MAGESTMDRDGPKGGFGGGGRIRPTKRCRLQHLPSCAEDGHGFIATQLDDPASSRLYHLACQRGEAFHQPRGLLVTMLLAEARVVSDLGEEEDADLGCRFGGPGAPLGAKPG